jgi:hypothetical protein
MSVRSEIIHGLKQFTERSVELMREIKSISTGEGGAESPENIMNLLLQTDTMLQAAMASCTSENPLIKHAQRAETRTNHILSLVFVQYAVIKMFSRG